MAKNKVYQWMDQLKGLRRVMPRDMTIRDTARMIVYCFWKTHNDLQKPGLPTIKNPLEKPNAVASKVAGVKLNVKKVGLDAIRDLQLPGTLSSKKKTDGEPKSAWSFDGFISKALLFCKLGSKQ